jgi:rare lipoprotein A
MKNLSLVLSILFLSSISLIAQSEEFGVASFYADAFDGRKTASGEIYDKAKMTAAHKELPFGTMIRVTRLDNNKSVVLRVNDRGPFISGRIVELSKTAAQKVGLIRDGIAEVKVEVVKERDVAKERLTAKSVEKPVAKPKVVPKSYDNSTTTPVVAVPETAKAVVAEKKVTPKPAPKKKAPKATPKTTSTSKEKLVQNPNQDGLYKIQLIRPEKTGYGVQIASMSDYENVFRQVTDLQSDWFKNILISVSEKGDATNYRIILGPFPDAKTAEAYKASLLKKKKRKGFVVDLSTL